jgi:CRISPR-associated protein Csx17
MAELQLPGLRPEPLALYLAALGILRLVGEQKDANARGCWRNDVFVLDTELDGDALVEFLIRDYAPTPVVGPWNGGSGFHPGDNTKGLDAILGSTSPRFAAYQRVIAEVRAVLRALEITKKPDKKDKGELIARIRAELSDEALGWIDAALVLTSDGTERFPPLLGTGGNDGRLEFSNNFMQRLAELLLGKQKPDHRLVRGLLFDEPTPGLQSAAVGQFFPVQAGGPNATVGFDAGSLINPWSYVLMIEGALVPSGAATRRLESTRAGTLSFPFTVRSALAGYASAASETTRDEMWMPLWSAPAGLAEVRQLFAEGRAKVATRGGVQRDAVDGLDFARAIGSLGISRGVESFARFGFQQRNGLSFFAVPLGRWTVRHSAGADLLAQIDPWLMRLRWAANSDRASGSLVGATRRLEGAIMDMCQRGDSDSHLEVLVALGKIESLLGRSKERLLDPVPALRKQWLDRLDDGPGNAELRLAASLASAGIRRRLGPVQWEGNERWKWTAQGDKTATWMDGADLVSNLIALVRRWEVEGRQQVVRLHDQDAAACGIVEFDSMPPGPRRPASLADISRFIDGLVDLRRIEELTRGLSLIDWRRVGFAAPLPGHPAIPQTSHALLRLARELDIPGTQVPLPVTPGLLANAASGHIEVATQAAIRRLRGVGYVFSASMVSDEPERARRSVAALAFPIATSSLDELTHILFPQHQNLDHSKDRRP